MATFMKNISLVSQSATLFRDAKLKDKGVTGFQAKYLLAVNNEEGISQEKLAKELFVNKSNVARQIVALEEAGYVKRVPDEQDKRALRLYLTEKGKELCPYIRELNAQWRAAVCEGFTEEEKELLACLVERMVTNAQRFGEEQKTEEKNGL